MKPNIVTLKNGLKVVFVDTKAYPSITTILLVGAGSRFENKENNGIAHFFEHMAFKGSKKYPNSFVISSTIEGLGGVFNAFTSKDHTGYWIKSTSDHFEKVVDVISDMVLNPILDKEEIEREKGVIKEEINMYEDNPQRKVGEIFEELLYKGNPLGFHIAGDKKTVDTFDRNTFVNYIKSLYYPTNAVLVVAGGIKDRASYLETIKEKFEDWRDGSSLDFTLIQEKQDKPKFLVKNKKTEQAHFCLGFRAFSFKDERKYALTLLSAILGGGMSSRLFIQVRERRGLCYYISTGNEFYKDCGNIVTQAGVTNDLPKIKEAIRTILKEHKKVIDGDIKPEEIKRAKELIKGRLLLSLEDSAAVASFFGTRLLLQNSQETPEELISKLDKVSDNDIRALAKDIFKINNLNFTLIGPFKEADFSDGDFGDL